MTSPFQRHYEAQQRDLDDAYRRVMRRGTFILGPELESFEQEFAAYCGTKHCVGVASGLDALSLVLHALGVEEGDEVAMRIADECAMATTPTSRHVHRSQGRPA